MPAANLKQFLAPFLPASWLGLDPNELHKILPLGEKFTFLLQEMGYAHIQASKPDTVGESSLTFLLCWQLPTYSDKT